MRYEIQDANLPANAVYAAMQYFRLARVSRITVILVNDLQGVPRAALKTDTLGAASWSLC